MKRGIQQSQKKDVSSQTRRFRFPLYFGWQVVLERISDLQSHIVGPFKTYRGFFTTVVVMVLIASVLLFTLTGGELRAATYYWQQTDWSGGQTANTADHGTDQSSWTEYSAADANVSAATSLTLTADAQSATETSATDFGAGTSSGTEVIGTGDAASIALTGSVLGTPVFSHFATPGYSIYDLAYDAANDRIWMTHGYTSGTYISRIDSDGSNWTTYNLGYRAYDILFEEHSNSIWTANYTDDTVTKIDPSDGTILATYSFPANSLMKSLAYDSTDHAIWAGDTTNDSVTRIVIDTGVQTTYALGSGANPDTLDYDPVTDTVWAVDIANNRVRKIDTSNGGILGTYVMTGSSTEYITYDPLTPAMWVNAWNFSNNAMNRFLTSDGTKTAFYNVAMPEGIDYDPDQDVLWVLSTYNTTLHKVNRSGSSLGSWATGYSNSSSNLVYDSVNKLVWIGHESSSQLERVRLYSYGASGTFTSQPIDTTANAGFGTASWTATTPTNTTLTIKARTSNDAGMSGATSWATCTTLTSGEDISTNNCVNDGERYIQYYAEFASSTGEASPSLKSITFAYDEYNNGTLTSSAYDTGADTNVVSAMQWSETIPAGTDVKFQVATAPDSGGSPGTWTSFMGPTGTGDYYSDPLGGETINAAHRDAADDQWVQYKIFLDATTHTATPTVTDVALVYVVNAPPELESAPTAVQNADGTVTITYSVRDIDTNDGSTTRGFVTPSFEYSINNGVDWDPVTTGLSAGAEGNKAVEQTNYTAYQAVWTAKDQIDGTYSTQTQIRVIINDNEPANNTASGDSVNFTLDAKDPVPGAIPIAVDARTVPAALTLDASDDTTLQMRYGLASDLSDGSWVVYSTSASQTLATNPDTVYVQFRDAFGNTSSIASVVTPERPANIIIRDISNPDTSDFRLFISWNTVSTPDIDFSEYTIYHSTDGSSYTSLDTISDRARNYYLHEGLTQGTTHYYKVTNTKTDGSISAYSAVVFDDVDGQGGSDATPPTLSNVAVGNITTQSATITWDTDELANSTVGYSTTPADFATEVGVATMVDSEGSFGPHQVILTGLTPNTTYYFQTKSSDPTGNEAADNNGGDGYAFSTLAGPAITNVTTSSIGNTTATINWLTDIASPSSVFYSEYADLSDDTEVTTATNVTEHAVVLPGLKKGTRYYFYVASGVATDTNAGEYYTLVTTSDSTPPVISAVTASPVTDTQAVIQWTTNEGASSRVRYGTVSGIYAQETTVDTSLNIVHTVTISNLTPDQQYYYVVQSADAAGNSVTSSQYTFTTMETLSEESEVEQREDDARDEGRDEANAENDTDAPELDAISVGNITAHEAVVTWTTDENANSFVQFGATHAYGMIYGNWVFTKAHSITLKNLDADSHYHYRVVSVDTGGNTALSGDSSFETASATDEEETTGPTLEELNQQLLDKLDELGTSLDVNLLELNLTEQLALIEELSALLPNPIISAAPQVTVSADSASIVWTTDKASNGLVAIAPASAYNAAEEDPYTLIVGDPAAYQKDHHVHLANLIPETTYHYQLRSSTKVGQQTQTKDFTFTTPKEDFAVQNYSVEQVSTEEVIFRWTTTEEASSRARATPYRNGTKAVDQAIVQTDDAQTSIHQITLTSLEGGVLYDIELSSTDGAGVVATKIIEGFSTTLENEPPVISRIKVDSALSPGEDVKVQTIISWETNEPATSRVLYREGVGAADEDLTEGTQLDANYTKHHVIVITSFRPGSVYQFRVESTDSSDQTRYSAPLTILTPQVERTVFQVIFGAIEQSFGWLKVF